MAKRKKPTTGAMTKYDAQLAAYAQEAAEQEANTGGGTFFSIRGGTLKLNDSPLPNNEMAVVIVDSVLENTYYEGDFDPDTPQSPGCFAFGRVEEEMKPHESVKTPEAAGCVECPQAEWGSAVKGRGKACRNRRRLALIPAGTIDKHGVFEAETDPKHFADAAVAYLALPPTSINGFGAYVKKINATLKRPPFAVFTKISLVPDEKTQVKVVFELLDKVDEDLISTLIERHGQEKQVIEFPYQPTEEAAPSKKKKKRGKTTTKRASRRGRKY